MSRDNEITCYINVVMLFYSKIVSSNILLNMFSIDFSIQVRHYYFSLLNAHTNKYNRQKLDYLIAIYVINFNQ